MSSPSKPHPYEAVVRHSGEVAGPIRLPESDSQRFIEAFNRLYRSAGLSITAVQPPATTASPNHDATADRH
mgnify:CR=1 FL=1